MRDVCIVLKLHTRHAHLDGEIRGSFSADGQRRSIVQTFTAALQSAQSGWQIEDTSVEASGAGQTHPERFAEDIEGVVDEAFSMFGSRFGIYGTALRQIANRLRAAGVVSSRGHQTEKEKEKDDPVSRRPGHG